MEQKHQQKRPRPLREGLSTMFRQTRYYPGQPHTEITLRVVSKHIMSIVPFLIAILLVSIAGIVGAYYLGIYQDNIADPITLALINLGGFLFMILLIFLFFSIMWIWRRNKLVITNEHIVDIDQTGLFNRRVSALRLEEIQDISAKILGPSQTIFQYGTLTVQTAGERKNFIMDYIYDPFELEHYILETRKKYYEVNSENPL